VKLPLQLEQKKLSMEDEGKCHTSFFGKIKGQKPGFFGKEENKLFKNPSLET
jgi:hypothetical protein